MRGDAGRMAFILVLSLGTSGYAAYSAAGAATDGWTGAAVIWSVCCVVFVIPSAAIVAGLLTRP